jgi:hypothetical protein
MTRQEKEFKILCEKFIQSPPKYRMKIVLPQLLESIEKNKSLNEGVLDDLTGTVKGWWQGTGVNSVWERVISSVLDGMGMEEGFLRDTVEVVLANSKWTELPGILTNCGKFSDLIVAQLPEIIAKYVAKQFVDEDILTVALRKTIVDTLATTEFAQSMKGVVRDAVCSALGWVGGLFGTGNREEWKKQQYQGSGAEYNKKAPVKFS